MVENRNLICLHRFVLERLGRRTYEHFVKMLVRHFFLWKNYRLSHPGTLRTLRSILYRAGALNILRERNWVIDRDLATMEASLGLQFRESRMQYDVEERLDGLKDPCQEQMVANSGAGNGRASYEMSIPGWCSQGWGLQLNYTLDATLRDCLKPDFRIEVDGTQRSYECDRLAHMFSALEALSATELAGVGAISQATRVAQVFADLQDITKDEVSWSSIIEITQRCRALIIDKARSQQLSARIMCALASGLLIDEIAVRAGIPNGMKFWFRDLGFMLEAAKGNAKYIKSVGKKAGIDLKPAVSVLAGLLDGCLQQIEAAQEGSPFPSIDLDEIAETADRLRAAGFKASETTGEPPVFVYSVANELWRWVFFLEQRAAWSADPADDVRVDTVLRWLARPWGCLNTDDLDLILRGFIPGDEYDPQPRSLRLVNGFFREEPHNVMVREFGFTNPEEGLTALRLFIKRRLAILRARRTIERVIMDDEDLVREAEVPATVIDAFDMCLFEPENEAEVDLMEADLRRVVHRLESADWPSEALRKGLPPRKWRMIQNYKTNPREFLERYFQFFESGFDITEHVYVFPFERFFLTPQGFGNVTEEDWAASATIPKVQRPFFGPSARWSDDGEE